MIITLIIAAIVAAWFSLEAESREQSKLFWIPVGIAAYLIPTLVWPVVLNSFFSDSLNRSNGGIAVVLWIACSQSIGLLSAAILRWQVSKKTGLEVTPPVPLIAFTICVHIALVVTLSR